MERFGRLVVFEHLEHDWGGRGEPMVRVRCECGARLTMMMRSLRFPNGPRDCGGHVDLAARDQHRANLKRRLRSTDQGLHRIGVEAGGLLKERDWPVSYSVVAGGYRSEHETFEEAGAEFKLRSRRKEVRRIADHPGQQIPLTHGRAAG